MKSGMCDAEADVGMPEIARPEGSSQADEAALERANAPKREGGRKEQQARNALMAFQGLIVSSWPVHLLYRMHNGYILHT